MASEELRCPKCDGAMPSRKRNGVVIEQCVSCHGIYLDPGELERLLASESSPLAAPGEARQPYRGRPAARFRFGRPATSSGP
jgi:hypothetical protein